MYGAVYMLYTFPFNIRALQTVVLSAFVCFFRVSPKKVHFDNAKREK